MKAFVLFLHQNLSSDLQFVCRYDCMWQSSRISVVCLRSGAVHQCTGTTYIMRTHHVLLLGKVWDTYLLYVQCLIWSLKTVIIDDEFEYKTLSPLYQVFSGQQAGSQSVSSAARVCGWWQNEPPWTGWTTTSQQPNTVSGYTNGHLSVWKV